MPFTTREVLETIRMVEMEHLDIRAVTLGISLRDCCDSSIDRVVEKVRRKIVDRGRNLVSVAQAIQAELGVPIVNKRVAVTPIAAIAESCAESDYSVVAESMDRAGAEIGIDFIGGFSALVQKGFTKGDSNLIDSIPRALARTSRVCSSINVASTKTGINMDAVNRMARVILETARTTPDGIGCCRLVVFANIPDDNPFVAGAMHGFGEPECVVNVGVSGPGVVRSVLSMMPRDADLGAVAEEVKKTAFKVTRMGELVGREAARRLGVEFGIVDLSLAPTPAAGDSVADILEAMGLERTGTHGTTAALFLLTDAVKKGGAMATSSVGGLSGAFIPVSEDMGMVRAVAEGALSLDKLEAMTSVCSVGLDMVAVPGDTPVETIAAIIADEMAIGVANNKTTAVRLLPVPGRRAGDRVHYGGLLGEAIVMEVNRFSSAGFIRRGGRIPAPILSLRN
jgi:uncharacterized protein (UPF0210 family)